MSNATWGESEAYASGAFPSSLLKHLLRHMMVNFSAQGGCFALLDESIGQMRVHLHLRTRGSGGPKPPGRRVTVQLQNDDPTTITAGHTNLGRMRPPLPSASTDEEDVEEITPSVGQLFRRGATYPIGIDLIGDAWRKNEACIMNYDDYISTFHKNQSPAYLDVLPTSLLVVPIRESTLNAEVHGQEPELRILGVIVLYQTVPVAGSGFSLRQRGEALMYAERVALYLQNEQLRRMQQRSTTYLQLLQEISTSFPTTVQLSHLVRHVYEFTKRVVDVSAVLLTLYDRDTECIYDVFAVNSSEPGKNLIDHPHTARKENRPVWWEVTQRMAQKELKRLHFSPGQDVQESNTFRELLGGHWGNQQQAESFLFLPMKMFTRVTGSLSIASMCPDAYQEDEIQVLETMLQIVSVSLENANLYARDHELLIQARYRQEQLAVMNSSLQSINWMLNTRELLMNLVKAVAMLVKAEMCIFFQLTPDGETLEAKVVYGQPPKNIALNDDSGVPSLTQREDDHSDLIESVHIPYKGSILTSKSYEGFFYLTPSEMEELAQQSEEGDLIFLKETEAGRQQMLMIPVSYKDTLIGMVAIHTPRDQSIFHPRAVGTLLAICSQAANAIHTAELFEEREEAYAELERMSKFKDEFLVTASHELRTPLTAIIGYASQLRRQSARSTAQMIDRYAAKISSAAQQLNDLIANMTEAAKLGVIDNKLDLKMGPVPMSAAVDMAVNLLNVNVEQQITYTVSSDVWVHGDALRIREVVSNLLDNAAKYSPPHGSIHVEAVVTTLAQVKLMANEHIDTDELMSRGNSPMVLVRVMDQGEGIHPEDQERIFEKFVRAPRSLTTPVRGSGLGLFISRRYIEAMGGRLWLERSESQVGSVFTFYLPMIDTPEQ